MTNKQDIFRLLAFAESLHDRVVRGQLRLDFLRMLKAATALVALSLFVAWVGNNQTPLTPLLLSTVFSFYAALLQYVIWRVEWRSRPDVRALEEFEKLVREQAADLAASGSVAGSGWSPVELAELRARLSRLTLVGM